MKSIFLSLSFIEMLIIIDLRVNVHNNNEVSLWIIFNSNSYNILSVNVDNMLDSLWFWLELIGPYNFLLISFNIFQNNGSTT
jgi:hypothetical protein